MTLDGGSRTTILVHFYRAMVGRADIWRTRMDATTNWSIGATAALISFALGDAATPHYVVFMAPFLTLIFLTLEARRLTFYHLWQQRVLCVERGLIAPALAPDATGEAGALDLEPLAAELAPQLGTTIPTMSLVRAISRRLRRVYVYLFAVQGVAWLLKLSAHPAPAASAAEWIARAALGPVPGGVVIAGAGVGLVIAAGLAVFKGGADSDAAADARRSQQQAPSLGDEPH